MTAAILRDVPSWEALADLYGQVAHDEEASGLVLAEAKRRERAERDRKVRNAARSEWEDAAYAQYLDADRVCRGVLVARGSRVTDAWQLWSGSDKFAYANCSEELANYWLDHARVTVTAYKQMIADGRRQQRDERDAEKADQGRESTMSEQVAEDRATAYAERREQLQQECERRAGQYRAQLAVRDTASVTHQRQAVDGAETLSYVRQFLARFTVWPSDSALTVATLWAMHAHCRDASGMLVFLSSPRLLFSSAEPGSGKSEAMKTVSRLCPSPVVMTEPSEPAVAHSIGAHESIFLDEADVLFGKGTRKAAIRAIINDGYTPDGVWARVRNGQVHRLCTFGPLALAGLDKIENGTEGQMAATLSRAWRLRMRRAPDNWRAPRYDASARYAAQVISERMSAWAAQNIGELATYVPEMPEGIGNRPAQLAEPLLIVADIAGGDWPEIARDAIEEMVATGGQPDDDEDKTARLDDIMSSWTTEED